MDMTNIELQEAIDAAVAAANCDVISVAEAAAEHYEALIKIQLDYARSAYSAKTLVTA